MKLLISTHNALLFWDGVLNVIHEGVGVYYGITWSDLGLYVVARGADPPKMLAWDKKLNRVPSPQFVSMGPRGYYSGPHQAFYWDDLLLVTNTLYNRLEIWDAFTGSISRLFFDEPVNEDRDHLNSIWRDPESGLFYVVEHRSKRIREFVLEPFEERRIYNAHTTFQGLHNVYVEDWQIFSLEPSAFVRFDLVDGMWDEMKIETVDPKLHYLRGLARTTDYWLIGVSTFAERSKRTWGASSVLFLDNDFQVVDELVLPEKYGQLLDIRVTDQLDLAHNRHYCPIRSFL